MATQTMDPARPATLQASPTSRAVGQLEEMHWLDSVGDEISKALAPVLENPAARPVVDALHGAWLGHALHPALSDLPIGFWSSSALVDVGGRGVAAGMLTAAGIVSSVATALTGVADWTATHGRERRLALLHGMVNTAALGLEVASLMSRMAGRRKAARRLSLAGLGVTSAAAYLGGELVFGRGVMVDHTAWTAGPADWTAVLPAEQLGEGQVRGVPCEGRCVLLHRSGGEVHAMEDACSHAGGPLHDGSVQDGVVTCPWHGSAFRLADGSLVSGPATFPQLRLQAREREGVIEVRGRQG
jgi:nitrite reductase/ring-hydroxylating ferredoxin subunit